MNANKHLLSGHAKASVRAVHRASVALISLIFISAFTLILVIMMSESSLSSSIANSNHEINRAMRYAAEACLEEGLLRLEEDPTFTGTTLTLSDTTSCSFTVSGSMPSLFSIEVNDQDNVQTFEADVNLTTVGQSNNATLLRWEEI